jgi:tetratricopeptide (TPR) repeat protein
VLEASFRLGEYYFDKKEYGLATDYYSKLLNHWQNPFFDMALYKLAWSYYNVNNFAKAISTFIYLIDDLNLVDKAVNAEVLGKTKADLRQESIEYLAQCFAEYGGPERTREFLDNFRGKDYGIDIFADIYQNRNFYDNSNKTLAITLELWPLYEKAPLLQNKIVENYLRSGDAKNAEAAREKLVKDYGPGSIWIEKYSKLTKSDSAQQKGRDNALALAEQNLYILGTEAQTRAQQSTSPEDYQRAIKRYQHYVDKFPSAPNAGKVVFYLAECHYDIQQYAAAADAYQRVMVQYPSSEFRNEAAYNRILSHFEELKLANAPDTVQYVMANFLGTNKSDTLVVPNKIYPKLLVACNDFVTQLGPQGPAPGKSDRMPELLMKYGETLYNLKAFGMAQQVYEKIITALPQSQYLVQAHLLHAQCSMEMKTEKGYLAAEKWARKVTEDYPDSTRQVAKAQRLISSAKFKLAEGFKERGELALAAKAFENIAASSQDSAIAEMAFAESAVQYDKSGDKEKAIEVYEKFYLKYPASPRIDEALFRAALLCEEKDKWTRASQNYLALVTARPHSPYAARSVFAAARCYENAGLLENALKNYERYLAEYPDEIDQYLEALCRVGEIHYQRKDYTHAGEYFQRTIARYRENTQQGLAVESYMAAQAQFRLGEMIFEDYKRVHLEPPIDKSLQRKQTLFTEVVNIYKETAKFQVAEWFIAASYRIGETYEEFGRAFWESPRPANVAEEVLAKYEEQLALKVRPFKERAYETYQGTLRQAEENGIANAWVDKSKERIQILAAELGFEQSAAPDSTGGAAPPPADHGPTNGATTGSAAPNGAEINTATAKGNEQ